MKVYISVDMEGITGINNGKYVFHDQPEYERGRKLLMEDLNAAIEGAVEAGATRVLVNDAHGSMRNVLIEDLHEKADLISGFPKKNLMMAGLDESFDAAMFIGYHSKAGSEGILAHTIFGVVIKDIKLNGVSYGETGLSAALAGHYKVPVVMISGDDIVSEEAKSVLPNVEVATTKEHHSTTAGTMMNPERSKTLIREKAKAGVLKRKELKPFILDGNIEVEISVKTPQQASIIEMIPGAVKISTTSFVFSAKNIEEVNNFISTVMNASCILMLGVY